MRIAILTTETIHHAYFVQAISALATQLLVVVETDAIAPPYPAKHQFEEHRDAYERAEWFSGSPHTLREVSETLEFKSANDAEHRLKLFNPELAIVFGTGRLSKNLIGSCRLLLNLHGGDPERYRGLDTHLWAIWHNDLAGLQTCLHEVAPALDTGSIVRCEPIDLAGVTDLYQLRKANTELCVDLSRQAIAELAATGSIRSRPQEQAGRYYSFMPRELKAVCVKKFRRFRGLQHDGLRSEAQA